MKHRFTDLTPTSVRTDRSLRLYISSWEIECCAPRPVVGFALAECIPLFLPARKEPGWNDLDEDIDTAKMSASAARSLGLAPGAHRGHLYGEFHGGSKAVEDAVPVSPGMVLRTRIVSFDRVLNSNRTWVPVPGSASYRDVVGDQWRFGRQHASNEAEEGTVWPGLDDGVLVDFLPTW